MSVHAYKNKRKHNHVVKIHECIHFRSCLNVLYFAERCDSVNIWMIYSILYRIRWALNLPVWFWHCIWARTNVNPDSNMVWVNWEALVPQLFRAQFPVQEISFSSWLKYTTNKCEKKTVIMKQINFLKSLRMTGDKGIIIPT